MKSSIRNILWCAIIAMVCGCSNAPAVDDTPGVFEYKEIYLPKSRDEVKMLGLNNIDDDWALWGHNLSSIMPKKPSQTIYAKSGGETTTDQFCFSSDNLFKYIEDYINNTYGRNESARFAILPNDNGIVCTCAKCKEAGNTARDASPAVLNMIKRLAERFPNHLFFTSYYSTTRNLPKEPMPENAGVLISTMDYPLAAVPTAKEQEFENLLAAWSKYTDRIYIWDYINNFDDYFTPFPIFGPMQRRLQIYERSGVKGIFMNGSGTDYSSLSRLKMYVLAAMLKHPHADWRPVVESLCREFYPTAGAAIARFVLAQEDFIEQQGKELPLYEGVDNALKTYLPKEEFLAFYDELQALRPKLSGTERDEVETLCRSLALTKLELMRLDGDTEGCGHLLDELSALASDKISVYNESCWTIANYVRDYKYMHNHAESVKNTNLLKGVKLTALTALDPDYSDISVLTDGLLGMPSNYHCGNMLSSADQALRIAVPYVKGMRKLCLWLSRNPAYKMDLPAKVILSIGGRNIDTIEPRKLQEHAGHSVAEFTLPASVNGTIVLTLTRDDRVRSMSLEEIEAF